MECTINTYTFEYNIVICFGHPSIHFYGRTLFTVCDPRQNLPVFLSNDQAGTVYECCNWLLSARGSVIWTGPDIGIFIPLYKSWTLTAAIGFNSTLLYPVNIKHTHRCTGLKTHYGIKYTFMFRLVMSYLTCS